MLKRFLAVMVIASALIASVGCANKEKESSALIPVNKTGYPVVSEKITLTAMGQTNSLLPDDWNDLLMFKEMEKMTNIHIKFILIDAGSYNERKNLAFASGDLPDFFFKGVLSPQDEMSYSSQNVLINLAPYLEYAPNFNKCLEEYPEVMAAITLNDGKIVSLPQFNDVARDRAEKLWINQKWLDKLGLKVPATTSEMYDVLKAFATKDPNGNGENDEIPMSLVGNHHIKQYLSAFGLLYDFYVDDNGKVVYSPVTEQHKEGLKWLRGLYSEGLMDNESFTQTHEKIAAKGSGQEEILGSFISMGAILQVGEERHADYRLVPPLKTDDGKQVWVGRDRFGKGTFAITNKNKYPEATMRWVDILYSEEGGRLVRAGIENETFKFFDNGTWDYIVPENSTRSAYQNTIGTNAGAFTPMRQPVDFMRKEADDINMLIDSEMDKLTPFLRVPYPQVYLNDEDQKLINTLSVDLGSYIDQFIARGITNDLDIDAEWNGYIERLNRMGLDKYLEIYQKAYDGYTNK